MFLFPILFAVTAFSFSDEPVFDQKAVSNLISELPYIQMGCPAVVSGPFMEYLRFYGLDEKYVQNYGYFLSLGRKIFSLITAPVGSNAKATIVLLHGYQEHLGNLLETAEHFLNEGYSVALYDMPGHGLSDGKRGSIDDFSGYSSVLKDFISVLGEDPGPVYFIGHSTACAAALELLHTDPGIFQKTVFVAPLVNLSFSGLIKVIYPPTSVFMKEIPRAFIDNSGDKVYEDYIKFMELKDPLQVRSVPLTWVKALIDWNDRLPNYQVISNEVCVVQGDADIVLDWKSNLDFLRAKFLKTEIHIIPGGKHILFHETPERRKMVYDRISDYLSR